MKFIFWGDQFIWGRNWVKLLKSWEGVVDSGQSSLGYFLRYHLCPECLFERGDWVKRESPMNFVPYLYRWLVYLKESHGWSAVRGWNKTYQTRTWFVDHFKFQVGIEWAFDDIGFVLGELGFKKPVSWRRGWGVCKLGEDVMCWRLRLFFIWLWILIPFEENYLEKS